jgi:antitoxin VapB
LARRVAELTGETMTEAVTQALAERLARLEVGGEVAEALLAIGRDCARRLSGPAKRSDHGKLLYDAAGLPK